MSCHANHGRAEINIMIDMTFCLRAILKFVILPPTLRLKYNLTVFKIERHKQQYFLFPFVYKWELNCRHVSHIFGTEVPLENEISRKAS